MPQITANVIAFEATPTRPCPHDDAEICANTDNPATCTKLVAAELNLTLTARGTRVLVQVADQNGELGPYFWLDAGAVRELQQFVAARRAAVEAC